MTTSTTIRLDERLKKEIAKIAKRYGLSFSDIINAALRAIADGDVRIPLGAAKYPPGYLEQLDKEVAEMEKLHAQGKLKTYSSAKELFDDILGR
jgi:addiction module RelB/DinJ family antitoxin